VRPPGSRRDAILDEVTITTNPSDQVQPILQI